MIKAKPFEPAPEGFAYRFVKDGWRGVERYYGGRTSRNKRWLRECGKDRLIALRQRYMKGDTSALDEARTPLTTAEQFDILASRKDEGKRRLAALEKKP